MNSRTSTHDHQLIVARNTRVRGWSSRIIWRKSFPPETPISGVDFDRLARLNLAGGTIQTAAVNAAFRAARCGSAVTMQVVLASARAELLKLDRPVNEADFRVEPERALTT